MSARSSSRSFSARSVPKSRIIATIHGTIASSTPTSIARPATSMVSVACRADGIVRTCVAMYSAYAAKMIAMPASIVHNWPSFALKRSQDTPMPTTPSSTGRISVPSRPVAVITAHRPNAASPAMANSAGFGACRSICSRLSDDCRPSSDGVSFAIAPVFADCVPTFCVPAPLPMKPCATDSPYGALPRDNGALPTGWLPAMAYACCTGSPVGMVIHRKM